MTERCRDCHRRQGSVEKERWQERDKKKRHQEELGEKAERRKKSDKGGWCVFVSLDYTAPQGNSLH